jgi:hypothetical protein
MRRVRLLALLAGLGQLVMVFAATIESWRGPDASAHVEARGTQLHHAHNEATCPACIVQALHAKPERRQAPPPVRRWSAIPVATVAWSHPTGATVTNSPRAPPTLR